MTESTATERVPLMLDDELRRSLREYRDADEEAVELAAMARVSGLKVHSYAHSRAALRRDLAARRVARMVAAQVVTG